MSTERQTFEERAAKANARLGYLVIDPATGKLRSGAGLHLTGRERRWASQGGTIFVTDPRFRLAGRPENIRAFLGNLGYTQQEINNAIANAITRENVNDPRVQAFIAREEADYRRVTGRGRRTDPLDDLAVVPEILAQLRAKRSERRAAARAEGAPRPRRRTAGAAPQPRARATSPRGTRPGARGGRARARGGARATTRPRTGEGRRTFAQAYADLVRQEPGKVYDVSRLTAEGKGYSKSSRPTTARAGRVGPSDLAIISSTESGFNNAIRLLGLEGTYGNWWRLNALEEQAPPRPVGSPGSLSLQAPTRPAPQLPIPVRPVSPAPVPIATTVVRTASPGAGIPTRGLGGISPSRIAPVTGLGQTPAPLVIQTGIPGPATPASPPSGRSSPRINFQQEVVPTQAAVASVVAATTPSPTQALVATPSPARLAAPAFGPVATGVRPQIGVAPRPAVSTFGAAPLATGTVLGTVAPSTRPLQPPALARGAINIPQGVGATSILPSGPSAFNLPPLGGAGLLSPRGGV